MFTSVRYPWPADDQFHRTFLNIIQESNLNIYSIRSAIVKVAHKGHRTTFPIILSVSHVLITSPLPL